MKYRVFTNDRGPHRYSCFTVIDAFTAAHAEQKAKDKVQGLQNHGGRPLRVLIVPEGEIKKRQNESQAAHDAWMESLSREKFPQ